MSGKMITKFQDGQHSELIAVILCAILSLIAISFICVRMIWLKATKGRKPAKVSRFMPEHVFFRTQLGAYVASLLLSNATSSVGYFTNITWLMQGSVTSGVLCTTQGALTQIGDLATAYFTAAIAVHTFCTLALRNRLPLYYAWIAVIAGWLLVLASGVVPSLIRFGSGPVYGTDGATCGISLQYPLVQLILHLIPVLVASLVASVFYALVFLNIRGTLSIRGGVKFNLDPEARWKAQDGQMEYIKFVAAIAKSMLIFPIAYVVLMMPHIVVCLVETSGWSAPFSAKVFAVACAGLLGVFNVLILYNTLRIMGPAFSSSSSSGQQKTDVESFASPEKSPVDVAPSVSAVLAQRAFPPPRISTGRVSTPASHQVSVVSLDAESTTHLLPPRPNHAHTSSNGSAATLLSLQRSITPVEELNQLIIPNAPMTPRITVDSASQSSSPDSDESSVHSLPAPRRPDAKKPHLRRPTVPAAIQVPVYPEYRVENGMLSAVNLQTPAKSSGKRSASRKTDNRDSFIEMYAPRSSGNGVNVTVQEPSPPRRSLRPSASTGNFADRYDISAFTSPRAAPAPPTPYTSSTASVSSPETFSARPVLAELPLSPFAAGLIERAARSPEHGRSQSDIVSPAFGSMSVIARDAVVRNASKRIKRRSKSLDTTPGRAIPEVLRPGTPLSTRARQLPPVALSASNELNFPATPRTPRTPAPGTSYSRARSPAPPLPQSAISAWSPPRSARRLPKTPTQVPSAGYV